MDIKKKLQIAMMAKKKMGGQMPPKGMMPTPVPTPTPPKKGIPTGFLAMLKKKGGK